MKRDSEVLLMRRKRARGRTQEQAARAGMSAHTLRRSERRGKLPSQVQEPRTYRTRPNQSLRQYATERLVESGETERMRERHRLWCMELAEQGQRVIWRADQVAWVHLLMREQDNMRAALRWTLSGADEPGPGLRIGAALGRYWDTRGDPSGGHYLAARRVALPTVRPRTPSWGRGKTTLGYLTSAQGNSDEAVQLIDESLVYCGELREPRTLAVALFIRGLAVGLPRFDEASLPLFAQSLDLSRIRRPRWTTYFSLLALGEAARFLGEYSRAAALLDESLSLVQIEGKRQGAFFTLNSLALLALGKGELRRAGTFGQQAPQLTVSEYLRLRYHESDASRSMCLIAGRPTPPTPSRYCGRWSPYTGSTSGPSRSGFMMSISG